MQNKIEELEKRIKELELENADLRAAFYTALGIESLDNENLIELIKRLIAVKEENNK